MAATETKTLEFGPLEPDVRYVIEGSPSLSFVPSVEANAFPSGGGALLSVGEHGVRLATSLTDVYVGRGDQEPIGTDAASVLEAFDRNERIAVSETGTTELGGMEVVYADFTLPFDANVEGGASIFSADATPLFLADLTVNRAFLIEHADGIAAVVVFAPEDDGVEGALDTFGGLLDSIQVGTEP